MVVAGGRGRRYGECKQFVLLQQKMVLWHSVMALLQCPLVQKVVVVVQKDNKTLAEQAMAGLSVTVLAVAGDTRTQTVQNGLEYLGESDWVLVHDAVRPCITPLLIEQLISGAGEDGALLALPITDAIKKSGDVSGGGGESAKTVGHVARDGLWQAQTPQIYPVHKLKQALFSCGEVADEAEAMTRSGYKPNIVLGDKRNIKITYPADLTLAAMLLEGAA